jgi:hypothetical protein
MFADYFIGQVFDTSGGDAPTCFEMQNWLTPAQRSEEAVEE